jgi:hypothetical protein
MWPGMKILRAALLSSVLLACASPAPETPLPTFGKSLASEADGMPAQEPAIVRTDAAGRLFAQQGETRKRELASNLNHAGFEPMSAARGLAADGRSLGWDWLATLSRAPAAGLAVLSIHDTHGRLAHEEVLRGDCSRLAWRDGDAPELLVRCDDHVWRYRPGSPGEPVMTGAQFAVSGSAFGPLSFGDGDARVRAALQLAGGVCRSEPCKAWRILLAERDFIVMPHVQQGALARITLFGPRRSRAQWGTKVRSDWRVLVSEVSGASPAEDFPYPSTDALIEIPEREGVAYAMTHRAQREGVEAAIGVFRDQDRKARTFGAIAVILPSSRLAPAPAAPAD